MMTEERRTKMELLKDHFGGVVHLAPLLEQIHREQGVTLPEAVDVLYKRLEETGRP